MSRRTKAERVAGWSSCARHQRPTAGRSSTALERMAPRMHARPPLFPARGLKFAENLLRFRDDRVAFVL